ncbi:MAG: 3-dehydroquinate synthase, partial [Alistipes sp.]|nr:3-dehydroquinate synthase [Alistipes sp.]
MKQVIEVKRKEGLPSQIVIGEVIQSLEAYLPQGHKIIIITDGNVHRRYQELINSYDHCLIGLGETIKTMATVEKLYEELLNLGADRSSFILGIGGGIVTDITGFVASTYMRGVRFGFVATTLLAQVDASVGGKNGVNYEGYKNMIGTFNQPDFVLCDLSMLRTLPEREFKAGLAEIIKSGLIADPELFALFEQHDLQAFHDDKALLSEAIQRAVTVKAKIVEQDERERGERRKLNLGHTFAHAIEKCGNGELFLHGEAVSIGTIMIARLSET